MIKFFRKIRQNLLSEGKTGKYFKYAIGEIILVVIGILIALQINNWNENRKNKITEANYYCRILDDFELNEKLIDENYELTTNRIELTKELIKDLNIIPNDRSIILNKFTAALRHDVSVPSNITFEDLTSSGQLKLLTDIKLKNRLIEYSTFLDNSVNLLKENRNEIVKRYTDFELITELGYQDIDYMKKELDKEHIALLPNVNWTNDPTHPYFIKFQDNLVFILGMQIRQKHHFSNLRQELQKPMKLLRDKKCK
ncbi:hypothetical protein G5B37_03890 [Rasiella rasia]|uniref:Uncharacterized protein n=1 Tax=Rasiella rasia TaxID=2744027 RepID=A0A6G6GJZ2_9FLAO|nr:DUF6090 family protein [Rasiella rasia]QIE58733.1 hypothetical protein G5B37_03890 [Rasiella rasia]